MNRLKSTYEYQFYGNQEWFDAPQGFSVVEVAKLASRLHSPREIVRVECHCSKLGEHSAIIVRRNASDDKQRDYLFLHIRMKT